MGFTFRKSIKIGKNTKINLSSKGGIGISTGVRGARVSVNQKQARVYGGVGPVRYQKQIASNPNRSRNDNSSTDVFVERERTSTFRKVISFVKKHCKIIAVIFIGFGIGATMGSVGRVSDMEMEEVQSQISKIESNIKSKETEIINLKKQIYVLEKELGL